MDDFAMETPTQRQEESEEEEKKEDDQSKNELVIDLDVPTILGNVMPCSVLRGLEPQRYTAEENVLMYCGLASFIAPERSTDALGMSMNHIRSAERDEKLSNRREMKLNPSHTSKSMSFHADRYYADIIAMYVKQAAAFGGEQCLASFWTIYNRLIKQFPDVVRILAQDFNWPESSIAKEIKESNISDLDGVDLSGPILFEAAGRVICQLVWQPFTDDPSLLSAKQQQAFDIVQSIAEEECIQLDHRTGDILFVNNLALLRARNAFVDSADKARHILRLGLRDPRNRWELPKNFGGVDFGDELSEGFLPLKEQHISVHDFDPWFATTVTACGAHG